MTTHRLDLTDAKSVARQLLSPGHPVRVVLEAEPDLIDGPEAVARAATLLRLVLAHRRRHAG